MKAMTVERVIFRLHQRGWTQRLIADSFGISQPRVSQIIGSFREKMKVIADASGGEEAEIIREFIGA